VTTRKEAAKLVQANSPSKWSVFANETVNNGAVRPTIKLIFTDVAAWRRGRETRKAKLIDEAKKRSMLNESMMAHQTDGEKSRDR
jgi:hypothetical protein